VHVAVAGVPDDAAWLTGVTLDVSGGRIIV